MTSVEETKAAARDRARERRARAVIDAPDAGSLAAAGVCRWMNDMGFGASPMTVATYLSISTELDTMPLIDDFVSAGHRHTLPVVTAPQTPLAFRHWIPGDPLVQGGYGTRVPSSSAPTMTPTILFVPLLAYDHAGYRLGYGGGFYDRTIADLRQSHELVTVGLAFSGQRVDTVPRDEFDEPLDWIATEVGVHQCGHDAQ